MGQSCTEFFARGNRCICKKLFISIDAIRLPTPEAAAEVRVFGYATTEIS
jgi:hypothetical protein